LPEYVHLVSLLQKGVGIHHAGMMSILREIVEILFAKGRIKMLFCTTSVAIGLNLPVRTCIFTSITKHDGDQLTLLQGHEYTQAAGRAGRLGLDTVGHVIHLNNLFEVGSISYKDMLKGKPQTLTSKFKVSYNLILNLLDLSSSSPSSSTTTNPSFSSTSLSCCISFAKRSMIQTDLNKQLVLLSKEREKIEKELFSLDESMKYLKTPIDKLERFLEVETKLPFSVNKKKKELQREYEDLVTQYKFIAHEKTTYLKRCEKEKQLEKIKLEEGIFQTYMEDNVSQVIKMLTHDGFIDSSSSLVLTLRGKIASQLREVHCLVFAKLVEANVFDTMTTEELVSLFSSFTSVTVNEENTSDATNASPLLSDIQRMYHEYMDKEITLQLGTGVDYTIHFDLMEYTKEWCQCDSVEECKYLLGKLEREKGIFLGEFVKALLKINNISCEFEKVAEMIGNVKLLQRLKEIPEKTLKYVVTNQSLYV